MRSDGPISASMCSSSCGCRSAYVHIWVYTCVALVWWSGGRRFKSCQPDKERPGQRRFPGTGSRLFRLVCPSLVHLAGDLCATLVETACARQRRVCADLPPVQSGVRSRAGRASLVELEAGTPQVLVGGVDILMVVDRSTRPILLVSSFLAMVIVSGCSGGSSAPIPTVTATATVTATVTAPAAASETSSGVVASAASQARYPSGDPVLPGYPLIVPTSAIDYRVANAISTEQVVAVAPGVYAAYSPTQTDLYAYLDLPNDGDCAVRDQYFPGTGGACWNGVPPSPEESSR